MHVLYEEEGEFKVGAVLAEAPASLQVESPHGRRSKIKAANVLMSFAEPGGAELLAQAREFAETLDVDFLWQCSGSAEFGFRDLAREYVGREATPVEAAGVLIKLHAAPIYFHRRGRGRYQAAPTEILKAALAAQEKKRLVQERIADWAARLARGECPPEIAQLRDELLYAPDRNKPETKAFEQACKETGLMPARLFERCGQLPDSHAYHLGRFLHEFYPRGTGFPPHELPAGPPDLPRAAVEAFSLDDIGTTEIDDAFSLVRTSEDSWRVGIHIAAPALGFAPGSPLDVIARERLSTAYMPGRKFTMLPDDAVERFSLDHGSDQFAVSLYVDVSARDFSIRGRHSRLERVRIAANLRHADYDALNERFEAGGDAALPTKGGGEAALVPKGGGEAALVPKGGGEAALAFEDELRTLWRFAVALEAKRGKPSVSAANLDYNFIVKDGRVAIVPRRRGAPLDKLVSELMILANTSWGELLAERDVAALYRVQTYGKVRMSVHPEAHEGLGVSCYAWLSSPLRRYVDLVNQWQLIAALSGARAPFARNSDALLSALRAFETTYARYDEHQRAMENYWCLRWLLQEKVEEIDALLLRENLVRLAGLPLVARVPSLPQLEPGVRVRLRIDAVDLLERSLACSYRATLGKDVTELGEDREPAE